MKELEPLRPLTPPTPPTGCGPACGPSCEISGGAPGEPRPAADDGPC